MSYQSRASHVRAKHSRSCIAPGEADCNAEGGNDGDGGGSAHLHVVDGVPGVLYDPDVDVDFFVRKPELIKYLETAPAVFDGLEDHGRQFQCPTSVESRLGVVLGYSCRLERLIGLDCNHCAPRNFVSPCPGRRELRSLNESTSYQYSCPSLPIISLTTQPWYLLTSIWERFLRSPSWSDKASRHI